jgi:cyclophilin family peptidyl-prolyl cis-trans isomerase
MGTEKRQRQKQGHQLQREELRKWEKRQANRRRLIRYGAIAVVSLAVLFGYSQLTGDDEEEAATASTAVTTTTTEPDPDALPAPTPCPPEEGVDEPVTAFSEAPPTCIDPAKSYTAVFDTTQGEIRVALDTENTPDTVNNFVVLARYGYYDGTPIFRTDPTIGIIQAGGADAQTSPGYTIPDEGDGFTYEAGQLVMARTGEPDSAGAQFFFVANDAAAALDAQGTYVVFGDTDAAGLDVVRSILDLHEDQPDNPLGGAPNPPVTINSVTIEES